MSVLFVPSLSIVPWWLNFMNLQLTTKAISFVFLESSFLHIWWFSMVYQSTKLVYLKFKLFKILVSLSYDSFVYQLLIAQTVF